VHSRGGLASLEGTLACVATCSLEKEFHSFSTTFSANRSSISGHTNQLSNVNEIEYSHPGTQGESLFLSSMVDIAAPGIMPSARPTPPLSFR
jgi:hypothetical protein